MTNKKKPSEVSKYKGSLREYTLLGISSVFKSIVSKDFNNFFGGESLEDIIVVIRNNDFYHFQIEEDVKRLGKSFLQRIDKDNIDLDQLFYEFDVNVSALEKIYNLKEKDLSLGVIEKFFIIYSYLIKFAYAAAYSLDVIAVLPAGRRTACKLWIEKARLRGENIYKFGEEEFIPRITEWLAKKKFHNYDSGSLSYLFSDELIAWIKRGSLIPSKKILEQRKKLIYVKFYPFEKYESFIGIKASNIIAEKNLFSEIDKKYEGVEEIKGQVAFRGLVSGPVRVIKKRADMLKFKEGEIIVSPMTDPSYLPVMKRAKAFITDEGGTLCHAAIVAREMKKPCVIGTKIATKVFKDGDKVEVDANKGVVRKIK